MERDRERERERERDFYDSPFNANLRLNFLWAKIERNNTLEGAPWHSGLHNSKDPLFESRLFVSSTSTA